MEKQTLLLSKNEAMIRWIIGKEDPTHKSHGLQPSNDPDNTLEMQARLKTILLLLKKYPNIVDRYATLGFDASPIVIKEIHSQMLVIDDFIQKSFPSLNNHSLDQMIGEMLDGMWKKLDSAAAFANSEAMMNESRQEYSPSNPSSSLETNSHARFQFVQDLNSAAPNLSNHIDNTLKNNSAYLCDLQRLNPSELGESCFLFGNYDTCTPLIHFIISTMKSSGDLKSFLSYMSVYALVVTPNMEIFSGVQRQMKHQAALIEAKAKANEIVTFNTKDPLSFVAKAFAEKEDGDGRSDKDGTAALSSRDAAALDAYNTCTGKDDVHLPSDCAVLTQKMKNVSSVALCIVMAVRVAKLIKMSDVYNRVKQPNNVRKQKLKLLFILGQTIKPDLSEKEILGMTLYQYFVDILYPTTDLSIDELFQPISISTDERKPPVSIIVQSSRFLKDEMNDRKFIDIFKQSESYSIVEDMDEFQPDEIQQRSDGMTDEDCYFCGRDKNNRVLTYRRKPCSIILFSLLNTKLLGIMLKPFGMQKNIIDVFLFGLLCTAPSHFARASGKTTMIPMAFLFDEKNYSRDLDIESAKDLIVDNIKPVVEIAIRAMKEFKNETHFAEKSDLTSFTTYLDAFMQNNN